MEFDKRLNIGNLIAIGFVVLGALGGYYQLKFNVMANEKKVQQVQTQKLDKELYKKDMEALREIKDELKKLREEVVNLRVRLGQ